MVLDLLVEAVLKSEEEPDTVVEEEKPEAINTCGPG